MISIDVELLTGRYAATSYNRRDRAEWPPHPARVYSALVAAFALDRREDHRRALDWLADQDPPWVVAPPAGTRAVTNVFVPVNDVRVTGRQWEKALQRVEQAERALAAGEGKSTAAERRFAQALAKLDEATAKDFGDDGKAPNKAIKAAAQMVPERRGKQPRTFPVVLPVEPRFSLVWPAGDPPPAVRRGLAELLRGVAAIGHSSSLVACRLGEGALAGAWPNDVWYPDPDGEVTLRVVRTGQLGRLERAFERHLGIEPRMLPCAFQSYRPGAPAVSRDAPAPVLAGRWVIFRVVGRHRRPTRVPLNRAVDIARALRTVLLKYACEPLVAGLSGHTADGKPLTRPHAAFVPLPDVAHPRYASGAILGAAVVVPSVLPAGEAREVMRAIGRWEQAAAGDLRLWIGRAGELELERVGSDPRRALQPRSWTRPARRWATVTPVALDRNPGDLYAADPRVAERAADAAQATVAAACEAIGLPAPQWVVVTPRSIYDAAPPARAFMPFPRKEGALRRVCVHAELAFAEPVAGPLLLGAGRYFGLGLCRPAEEWERR